MIRATISEWMRGWVARGLALALSLGLFVLLVGVIYRVTRARLHDYERFSMTFAEIECVPPPGEARADFLVEVQYLAEIPDKFSLLDAGLTERLARAFALHPWVEEVVRVEITPARQVVIHLRHRTPVLAVASQGTTRAVDRHGILLPKSADTRGLPVYAGTARPPTGTDGQPWGDPAVEAAARRTR